MAPQYSRPQEDFSISTLGTAKVYLLASVLCPQDNKTSTGQRPSEVFDHGLQVINS